MIPRRSYALIIISYAHGRGHRPRNDAENEEKDRSPVSILRQTVRNEHTRGLLTPTRTRVYDAYCRPVPKAKLWVCYASSRPLSTVRANMPPDSLDSRWPMKNARTLSTRTSLFGYGPLWLLNVPRSRR